jgi:hypothetical protein
MKTRRDLPGNFYEHGGPPAPWWPLVWPAETVLPFIRSPLGFDIVYPKPRFVQAVMLFMLPPLAAFLYVGFGGHVPPNLGLTYLTLYFAPASLILSLLIFVRRCWGQRRSEEVHSGECGWSWVTRFTNLPLALCEQILTPAAVFLAGYAIAHSFSVALGYWLEISGVSLFILARWEHRRLWHHRRMPVDDMLHAKGYESRIERYERRGRKGRGDGPDEADVA